LGTRAQVFRFRNRRPWRLSLRARRGWQSPNRALVHDFASRGIATGVNREELTDTENMLAEGAFFTEP
jgi:hypothetical protein